MHNLKSSDTGSEGVFRRGDEILHTTPSSHASENSRVERRRSLRRNICVVGIILLLVIIYLVAVRSSKKDDGADQASTVLSSFLTTSASIDSALLKDPDTPQSKALQWIVKHNPTTTDHWISRGRNEEDAQKLLLQRYVLVVFFFSTLGTVDKNDGSIKYSSWNVTTNWMTDQSVCTWYGVNCLDEFGQIFDDLDATEDGVIESLQLPSNSIIGILPDEIRLLGELQKLDLRDNALEGTLPSRLSETPKLKELVLAENQIGGKVPTQFGQLQVLEMLDLSQNELEGSMPDELGYAFELRYLNLEMNDFKGKIADLSLLGNLEELNLRFNTFYGTLPDFYNMYKMKLLTLAHNELTGTIPTQYRAMTLLETLNLANNELTGAIPGEAFQTMDHLKKVILSHNRLSGAIPSELASLGSLEELDLGDNDLSGSIDDWSPFAGLTILRVHNNHLSGELPNITMPSMRVLVLSMNNFMGYIPTQFADMIQLRELILADIELSGTIPGEIFQNMVDLRTFNLEGNHIVSGTIPTELEQLNSLSYLGIEETAVTGTVSSVICDRKISGALELTVNCEYIECDCCDC